MNDISISNSISKESVIESNSIYLAYENDALSRHVDSVQPEAISNEHIQNGDLLLETYKVVSDAILGGMGSVWQVHHLGWNIELAMKRPQPRFFAEGSDRRKAEFIAECEYWINLGLHPNIVSCYYVRDIGGVPTVFSEWMDGGSLKDAIRFGLLYKCPEETRRKRILDIAIQTARGLKYAHDQGLIHQDVKPGNILLTKEWEAKVGDFGLARAENRLNGGDSALPGGYTTGYCPKEQAEGATPEPWMDVYAWALTITEMYAGKRLWISGAEAANRPDEIFLDAGVPEELIPILRQCLTACKMSFTEVEDRLTTVYESLVGEPYFRYAPKSAIDTADSLNNRALSFLDLGMPEEAEKLWNAALLREDGHPDSLFNRAMYRWITGKGTDIGLLNDIGGVTNACRREELQELAMETRREILEGESRHDANCIDHIAGRSESLESESVCYCDAPDGGGYIKSYHSTYEEKYQRLYRVYPDGDKCILLEQFHDLYMDLFDGSVSADGDYLVLSNENRVTLYDILNGQISYTEEFAKPKKEPWQIIRSVCAGLTGEKCYIGKTDGIYIYDFLTHEERQIYTGGAVLSMKLRDHGRLLVFLEKPDLIKAIIPETGKLIAAFTTGKMPRWYEVGPDGKELIVYAGGTLIRYDIASGGHTIIRKFPDTPDSFGGFLGKYAVTYTSEYCSIWNMETSVCLRSIRFSSLKQVRLSAIRDGKIEGYLITGYPSAFNTFSISTDPPKPVWVLGSIRKTELQTQQDNIFLTAVKQADEAIGRQDWITAREYLAQARAVQNRKNDRACLRLYDTLFSHFRRGKLEQSVAIRDFGEQFMAYGSVVLSDDGRFLLGGRENTRNVYHIRTGEQILSLKAHDREAVLALDGTRVAAFLQESGLTNQNGTFVLYRLYLSDEINDSGPKAELLCSHPVKCGLHPFVQEVNGKLYVRSDGFLGHSVNLTVDAATGKILPKGGNPDRETQDAAWKEARRHGMRYTDNVQRIGLDSGKTAFYYSRLDQEDKKRIWRHILCFLDANGQFLGQRDLAQCELEGAIHPMKHSLIQAKRSGKEWLFEAEDFLHNDHPDGYELPVPKETIGIRTAREGERKKIVKEEAWGSAITSDCRYLFLSGRVYRLEWELL